MADFGDLNDAHRRARQAITLATSEHRANDDEAADTLLRMSRIYWRSANAPDTYPIDDAVAEFDAITLDYELGKETSK